MLSQDHVELKDVVSTAVNACSEASFFGAHRLVWHAQVSLRGFTIVDDTVIGLYLSESSSCPLLGMNIVRDANRDSGSCSHHMKRLYRQSWTADGIRAKSLAKRPSEPAAVLPDSFAALTSSMVMGCQSSFKSFSDSWMCGTALDFWVSKLTQNGFLMLRDGCIVSQIPSRMLLIHLTRSFFQRVWDLAYSRLCSFRFVVDCG